MTKQERSWIIYDWANSAYTLIIVTAVLPGYFKQVAAAELSPEVSTAYWGYASSAVQALIVIAAPLLGTLADYRGAKKNLFLFFFVVGVVGAASLATVHENEWVRCLVLFGISSFAYTATNIFYDAFITDVTDDARMDWVSSLGFAWGYIGSTIPYIAAIVMISKPALFRFTDAAVAVRGVFILTALWWLLFTMPLLRHVKQTHYVERTSNPLSAGFIRLFKTLKTLRQDRFLVLFLAAYFCYIDGVNTIIKMATAYGLDLGLEQKQLLVVLLAVQLVAFPCAMIYGKLARIVSAKTMILVGIGVYFFVTIYALFVSSIVEFWVLAMLIGSAQGGIQALSRSLFAKLIPKEKSGEYFGLYNIVGKFASVIGPGLVAATTQLTGSSRYGVLSLIILFALGGAVLLRLPSSAGAIESA